MSGPLKPVKSTKPEPKTVKKSGGSSVSRSESALSRLTSVMDELVSESVARCSASVHAVDYDMHPGYGGAAKVSPNHDSIKILANMFQPWSDIKENGSGLYALSHWAAHLDDRAAGAGTAAESTGFIRGLIYR